MSIVEENPLRPADAPHSVASAHGRAEPFGAGIVSLSPDSPAWAKADKALEALRGTLDGLGLLKGQPAVAHDFVAVLAALDAVRGLENAEPYWQAQLARLSDKRPPQTGRTGSLYLRQLTGDRD